MTLADLDAVIAAMATADAKLREEYAHGVSNGYWPTVAPILADSSAALATLRTWRENAVEGWVFLSGLDSANQDAHNFYDGSEPDDHDGRALLLLSPEPKP